MKPNYDEWVKVWSKTNPDRIAPTKDEFEELVELFDIKSEEICIPQDQQ